MSNKPSVGSKSTVVFLVHGTFARDAAWTQPESYFRRHLRDELTAEGFYSIQFKIVNWSGGNSHRARREAAIKLKRAVRAVVDEYPSACYFVIGHSHGGNIALRALRGSTLQHEKCGIVTLATPFLKFRKVPSPMITWPMQFLAAARAMGLTWIFLLVLQWGLLGTALWRLLIPREEGDRSFGAVVLILYLLGLGGAIWIATTAGPTFGHWMTGVCSLVFSGNNCDNIVYVTILGVALVFTLVIAYVGGRSGISSDQLRELARLRRTIFERYAYSQPNCSVQVPVLAMSSAVDEALGILSGAWIIHRWIGWVARVFSVIVLFCLLALSGGLMWLATRWVWAKDSTADMLLWGMGAEVGLTAAIVIVCIASGIAVLLLSKISGHSNLVLGLANPDHNLLWTVHAQRDPGLENAKTIRYSFWKIVTGSKGLLLHSRLYTYGRAVHQIARWINCQRDRWELDRS